MIATDDAFTAAVFSAEHLQVWTAEVLPGDFHTNYTRTIMSVRICVNVPAHGSSELYCTRVSGGEHVWIA